MEKLLSTALLYLVVICSTGPGKVVYFDKKDRWRTFQNDKESKSTIHFNDYSCLHCKPSTDEKTTLLRLRGGEIGEHRETRSLEVSDISNLDQSDRYQEYDETSQGSPHPDLTQASTLHELQSQIKDHMREHSPRYLEHALQQLVIRKPVNRMEEGFIQQISDRPTSLDLLERYGVWLLETMDEPNRAEKVYRYALLIQPSSSKFYFLKAEALESIPDKSYDAEAAYRQALMYDPHYVAALTGYGRLLLDEFEDQEGANAKLEQAVAIDPHNADALCQRARAYEACGDAAAAERTYRRALRAEPGSAAGLNNYATLLMERGRPAEALDVMLQGLRASDRAGAVVYNYGLLLEQLGEEERAAAAFKEAADKGEAAAAAAAHRRVWR
jgi:Tfp pilus assembly protein PilF